MTLKQPIYNLWDRILNPKGICSYSCSPWQLEEMIVILLGATYLPSLNVQIAIQVFFLPEKKQDKFL